MKICAICHKGSIMGGGYSNRIRATKYNPTGKNRRKSNLQAAVSLAGKKILICTGCLKKNLHLTKKV